METSMRWIIGMAALSAAVACEGGLGQGGPTGSDNPVDPGAGSGGGGVDKPVELSEIESADPESLPDGVSSQSRVPRLSHGEFDRTVSDLLFAELTPSDLFPAEQPNLGPYEDVGARGMSDRLLQEVVLAAQVLA
jgi:Protein of unknown function (DUF1587)